LALTSEAELAGGGGFSQDIGLEKVGINPWLKRLGFTPGKKGIAAKTLGKPGFPETE